MRVIVCGSRTWTDSKRVFDRLATLPQDTTIVHGMAHGADHAADWNAKRLGLKVEPWLPEWKLYGKAAGCIRNQDMLDSGVDLVIAFWDGSSKGTAHMIRIAKEAGVPVEVIQ